MGKQWTVDAPNRVKKDWAEKDWAKKTRPRSADRRGRGRGRAADSAAWLHRASGRGVADGFAVAIGGRRGAPVLLSRSRGRAAAFSARARQRRQGSCGLRRLPPVLQVSPGLRRLARDADLPALRQPLSNRSHDERRSLMRAGE